MAIAETTNYKFKKPDKTERFNIDTFNNNSDAIDTAIENRSTFGTTLPSSGHKGDRFYNTGENKEYYYNGSAWTQMQSGKEYTASHGLKIDTTSGNDIVIDGSDSKLKTITKNIYLPGDTSHRTVTYLAMETKAYDPTLDSELTGTLTIPSAQLYSTSTYPNGHAGLYNKDLADAKVDVLSKDNLTTPTKEATIKNTNGQIDIIVDKPSSTEQTLLRFTTEKIYYVKADDTVSDDDEILTIKNLPEVLNATFRGRFNTKADLPTTGIMKGDTAMVVKDETKDNSSTLYRRTETDWEYMYNVADDCIRLLGNATSAGEPYHFPFNIRPIIQNTDSVVGKFDTITLDNLRDRRTYDITLPAADFTDAITPKAGVYTKTLADKKINVDNIKNNCETTDEGYVLDARQGRLLAIDIAALSAIGRFLSVWDCSTGKPSTEPTTSPYTYKAGDYYVISKLAEGTNKNYRPSGSTYTHGQPASTTEETATAISVNDTYRYDGTNWMLLHVDLPTTAFQNIVGEPYDNTNLAAALNAKLTKLGKEPVSQESYHFPFYFKLNYSDTEIDVEEHTRTLDDNESTGTQVYHLSVPAATESAAGLMTAADRTALTNFMTNDDVDALFGAW